ncbi:MAG: hypothetical protein ACRENO_02415 [Thermodesulfobacteriota bacterium]
MEMKKNIITIAGNDNTLGMPIHMLPLDSANASEASPSEDVTLLRKKLGVRS